jgi:thiamine-monophosphate kinase
VAAQRLGEFERIRRFFAPLAGPGALGLRDDAALIDGPDGQQYILTADAIVEGVHFLSDDPPAQVAQKLLRVNLSDLAAKGAVPVGYLLVTALPRAHDEAWLEAFAAGLAADQASFGIALLGGDSTATDGPATLSITALGRVASGCAVLRSGARPGDGVYVSGTLGDAALGLQALASGGPSPPARGTSSPSATACRNRGWRSASGWSVSPTRCWTSPTAWSPISGTSSRPRASAR